MYSGCSAWSWTDVEMEEEELVQEINSSLVSPDFVVALRVLGTGEPVPLSLLTIEQLCEVVEAEPVNERKAFVTKAEDKRIYEILVKEAKEKSAENSPNSTSDLVEWVFSKIVVGLAKGIIRTVVAMDSRGARLFLLPKRNIWLKKGGRVEETDKEAEKEDEDLDQEACARRKTEEEEASRKRKQKEDEDNNKRQKTKIVLADDSEEEDIKDFWGPGKAKQDTAAGRDKSNEEVRNVCMIYFLSFFPFCFYIYCNRGVKRRENS